MTKFAALAAFVAVALHVSDVAGVAVWGQCGGINYTGDKNCESGTTCVYVNDWYSQCQPGSGGGGSSTPRPTSTTTNPPTTTGALDARFKAKGRRFWGTASDRNLLNNAQNSAIIRAQFGSLTPENSMKWDALEKSQNSFTFSDADFLVDWAQSNGKSIRGHTLVWHSQLPSWVSSISSASTLTSVINNHISTVAGRYRGKIYAWDVVNEIFNENGTFRSSVFYNVLGESFVALSFRAARAADPSAKLYINDYNLDSNNSKVAGVVNIVKKVNGGGTTLIDGIGTQMHLQANGAGGVLAALQALAAAGTDVAITELDIVQAAPADYQRVVSACLQVSRCVSITSWGVSDKDSWRASSNPLLFDGNYQPKAAFNAVLQSLA